MDLTYTMYERTTTLFLWLILHYNTSQNYAGFSQQHSYVAFVIIIYIHLCLPPQKVNKCNGIECEKCSSECLAHREHSRNGDSGYSWYFGLESQRSMEGEELLGMHCWIYLGSKESNISAPCFKTTHYMKIGIYGSNMWLRCLLGRRPSPFIRTILLAWCLLALSQTFTLTANSRDCKQSPKIFS